MWRRLLGSILAAAPSLSGESVRRFSILLSADSQDDSCSGECGKGPWHHGTVWALVAAALLVMLACCASTFLLTPGSGKDSAVPFLTPRLCEHTVTGNLVT